MKSDCERSYTHRVREQYITKGQKNVGIKELGWKAWAKKKNESKHMEKNQEASKWSFVGSDQSKVVRAQY